MRQPIRSILVAASSLALVATVAAAPAQARSKDPEVVASGLVGPLSLTVGKGKDLYVTQNFVGVLSKITKRGGVETVTSITNPETQSLGGVAYHKGATYHLESDFSGEMPVSQVIKIDKRGTRTVVSDNLWAHEMEANPDAGSRYGFVGLGGSCAAALTDFEAAFPPELGDTPFLQEYSGIVESNAYQLTVAKDGTIYVADAAANAILKVNRKGKISTVSVLPASTVKFSAELEAAYEGMLADFVAQTGIEMNTDVPDCVAGRKFTHEPVPTDVQVGHKGKLYVSTLQGLAGEILPLSKVYRVNPKSGSAKSIAGGMHGVTGLAIADNGRIFVAELFGGEVSVIDAKGRVRNVFEAPSPSDVTVNGAWVYATTGVFGPDGSVVKYHYAKRR